MRAFPSLLKSAIKVLLFNFKGIPYTERSEG
jgi:hypothetical protein